MKKDKTMVVITKLDKSNIVLKDGLLSITPYEGNTHQGVALHVISTKEIVTHRALKDGKYYYIKYSYKEWYVGKYNETEKKFYFIDDRGSFGPISVDNCFEVIASTVKDIPSNNIIPKHSIRRFIKAFNVLNVPFNAEDESFPNLGISHIDLTYLTYK